MNTAIVIDVGKDTELVGQTLQDFDMIIPCTHALHTEEHIKEEAAYGLFEFIMPCGYTTTGYLCESGYQRLDKAPRGYCSNPKCNQLHLREDIFFFLIDRVN